MELGVLALLFLSSALMLATVIIVGKSPDDKNRSR